MTNILVLTSKPLHGERKHSKKPQNYGRSHCVGIFVRSAPKIPTQGFSHNFEAFLSTPSLHVRRFSVRTRMLVMCPTQSNSFCGSGTVMFHDNFLLKKLLQIFIYL